MKNKTNNFKKRQRFFLAFLLVSVIGGISFLINHTILAESGNNRLITKKNDYAPNSFIAPRDSAPTADIGERTSVWLKLLEGKPLETTFYGNDSAISSLQSNLAEPLSQASADFNSDGYPDLVSGFRNGAGGGLIALHRANVEAFMPQDEQVLADLRRGIFPNSFETNASIIEVPTAPDFILTGKFTQDSAVDLVFASRGGSSIYLMTSDGKGGFNAPQEIAVGGEITALAADLLNFKTSTYIGIVAAVRSEKSSYLAVFDGRQELGKAAPRNVKIDGEVTSLVIANPYGGAVSRDIFGLADGDIFTVHGIETRNPSIIRIELPFRSTGIAVGNFIADRQVRAEIAVLAENGNVAYLTHGTPDTRPFTAEEMRVFYATHERGVDSPVEPITDGLVSDKWEISEQQQLGVYALGENNTRVLQKAYITGNETEDLLITDANNKQIQILFKEPNRDENRTTFTGETKTQPISFSDSPAAVLPMRLNVMGQQGFVYFGKGSIEPTPVMLVPNATFTVTTTNDENNGACSGAGTGCSVREAVIAANGAAGADMVVFGVNGTHTHTIAGLEDSAAQGDLDILEGLTMVGNGAANTIVQAGATTATGIDKVFSVNPLFTTGFATSFSSMTIRNGNNTATSGIHRFGGGMDWEGRGVGTLTFSGVTVSNNQTAESNGGGVFTSGLAGTDVISFANSNLSNNISRRVTAAGANGGGISLGSSVGLNMTGTVVSGNTASNITVSPNIGNGGGVFFTGTVSGAGRPFFTNTSFTSNTAAETGGGIFANQPIDVNPIAVISNNTAQGTVVGNGGGIYIIGTGNSVISKATMVGNSARVGGAIFLDNAGGNPTLNMTFSRITGNTATTSFSGVAVEDATATAIVENNWWGCNTGPNTAGCDGVGTVSTGIFDFNPWLQLRLTAGTTTPVVGQSTGLTASFLLNSAGQAISASNLDVLIGRTVSWSASAGGTISGQQTTIQANGQATATYTATSAGARTATAQVDNAPATVNFTVGQAATTTTITSDNPDPSVRGQTVTVTYTVTVNAPGMGTPTGTVTISDGVNSCVASVATGSCNLALTTVGARTLTATYSGDANFSGSVSAGVPHQVNPANTSTLITAESADPTAQGEVFTVFYSVSVTAPGTGTPTGTVTISDGINACVGSVAAGQCSLFLNTTGMRTLTATYSGSASFNGSVSPGEPHTVLPILAASVSISGRVQTQSGRGIANARIILTDQNGEIKTALSNAFGYYYFEGVPSGETYFFTARHKEYQFAPRVITILEDVQGLDFTALN